MTTATLAPRPPLARPLAQPAAQPTARAVAGPSPRRVLRGPRGASHHGAGVAAARPVGTLRLTARGRVVLLLAAAALTLLALSVGRAASQAAPAGAGAGAGRPVVEQVTVQPGETLWAIARRVAPGSDPRQVTAQLMRLNRLPDPQLRAGQQLLLPTR